MKVRPVADDSGAVVGYSFRCPGCECGHVYYVAGSLVWSFNGDLGGPSFEPSLLNTCEPHPDPRKRRCHLHLRAGVLEFYEDCSHDYAGKLYPLPDID